MVMILVIILTSMMILMMVVLMMMMVFASSRIFDVELLTFPSFPNKLRPIQSIKDPIKYNFCFETQSLILCHFFRQKSDNFQTLMNVDGYAVADNGYGDDKVVLSFELILTLMNHSLMVLTLMIKRISMQTLIRRKKAKAWGS